MGARLSTAAPAIQDRRREPSVITFLRNPTLTFYRPRAPNRQPFRRAPGFVVQRDREFLSQNGVISAHMMGVRRAPGGTWWLHRWWFAAVAGLGKTVRSTFGGVGWGWGEGGGFGRVCRCRFGRWVVGSGGLVLLGAAPGGCGPAGQQNPRWRRARMAAMAAMSVEICLAGQCPCVAVTRKVVWLAGGAACNGGLFCTDRGQ